MVKQKFYLILLLIVGVPRVSPFPPPHPLIKCKIFIGMGVPLNLEEEAISYGWTLKAQYFFPTKASQVGQYFPLGSRSFLPKNQTYFDDFSKYLNKTISYDKKRKKREIMVDKYTGQRYEKYDVQAEEIGSENLKDYDETYDRDEISLSNFENFHKNQERKDTSGTRWLLYDGFGRMLTLKGLNGRYCVLRSICEAAETNFGYHNGLFGQLFHLFFTPSSTDDPIVNKDHYDYVKAEMLGLAGEPCDKIFHQCERSILDIFTKVYDFNVFNFT